MEITFSQTTYYSVSADSDEEMKSLAKALDVTPKKLDLIIEEGELLDGDRYDQVVKWIDSQAGAWDVTDEDSITDLEVHV